MNSTDLFETIVSEQCKALFRFAMSLTQSESDAQDLTQQTFYVWATKGHQLRGLSKAKTWLITTLHRIFLNMRERQGKLCDYESEGVSAQLPVISPNFVDRLDSYDVLVALGKVDDVYQAAVALFYLEDYSYKEIAAILEVPIGTVKSRIARGIAQLRQFLLSDDFNESDVQHEKIPSDTGVVEPMESDYEEWDLSATRLPEHSNPAGIVQTHGRTYGATDSTGK